MDVSWASGQGDAGSRQRSGMEQGNVGLKMARSVGRGVCRMNVARRCRVAGWVGRGSRRALGTWLVSVLSTMLVLDVGAAAGDTLAGRELDGLSVVGC